MKLLLVDLILVSLGGVIGALSRYGCTLWLESPHQKIPWATLTVNLLGSFALGWLYGLGWFQPKDRIWLMVAVGFLGSLTTFSTFTLETLRRLEAGEYTWAASYMGLSLIGGLAAVTLGVASGRGWGG